MAVQSGKRPRGWSVCAGFAPLLLLHIPGASGAAAPRSAISRVELSRPFFNPFLGQKIEISFAIARPGELAVLVLDRDGFPVRTLRAGARVDPGKFSIDWDGRSDVGEVVPDEAYSLKIDLGSDEIILKGVASISSLNANDFQFV